MKLFTSTSLCTALVTCVLSASATEQKLETISLDLANISFSQAIAQLARSSKRTYVVHPQVQGLKSSNIRLDDVPLPVAFGVLLAAYDVCAEDIGKVTRLAPCPLIEHSQRTRAKDPSVLIDNRFLK